jgi:hypothetical protein
MPRVPGALVLLAVLGLGRAAHADAASPTPPPAPAPKSAPGVVVWPTMTPAGDAASPVPLHRPVEATEPTLALRAQELDATLRDGVQDLGFVLDVADPGPASGHTRDEDILARAATGAPALGGAARSTPGGTWVVSARLEAAGSGAFLVRMVAAPPGGVALRVRVERVKAEDVSVRGLVLLRDLLATPTLTVATESPESKCLGCASLENVNTEGLRSPGRALLALNGGLFGGYVGYSLQRASGSTDPRVLYPLLALGTGIGVGTALLVSDEWDLSTGDAWFLAAGAWWGAGAGILVANGHGVPLTDRYAYGVASGVGGIALATFALTRSRMDEGDALLTHSGGALGLFVGGLAELAYKGTTAGTPDSGAGYGAAIGVVGAGTLATFVRVSPSRVALVDLGAALGALGGAAAASPLVFQDVTAGKNRAFLAATLGGTAVGGGLAWYFTRGDKPSGHAAIPGTPTAGVIGSSTTATGTVPAYGVGWVTSF